MVIFRRQFHFRMTQGMNMSFPELRQAARYSQEHPIKMPAQARIHTDLMLMRDISVRNGHTVRNPLCNLSQRGINV